MSIDLKRAFVAVRGRFGLRQVHYRSGGQGPVVVLLHQSPQSSREMETLIHHWGRDFRLIAPDAPGYGFSTPLCRDGTPLTSASIDDFAAATVEFLDALGIRRCGIYGFHTGASIAVALAGNFPERVAAVSANGLAILDEDELAFILGNYLPPLEPRWDGGHLAWLWARLREQTIFFPWHDRRAGSRLAFDVPPPAQLQRGVEEFLAAGDHYRVAYAAAFDGGVTQRLPRIPIPLLVTATARDPLAGHLGRIDPALSTAAASTLRVEPSTDAEDALRRCRAHLLRFSADAAAPAADPSSEADGGNGEPASTYHGAAGRQIRTLQWATATESRHAVILIHAPAGSAAALERLARTIAGHAAVHAPDLPGHGASDSLSTEEQHTNALDASVAMLAAALSPLTQSLARRGATTTIVGVGSSAPLAVELSRILLPARPVLLLDVPAWSAADIEEWRRHGLPSLAPVWAGGHLLEAWHLIRDGRLFSPWFERRHTAIRPGEPQLDNLDIHRDVRDLLRANGHWQPLLEQILGYWLEHGPGTVTENRSRSLPGQHRVVIRTIADPVHWARVLDDLAAGPTPTS